MQLAQRKTSRTWKTWAQRHRPVLSRFLVLNGLSDSSIGCDSSNIEIETSTLVHLCQDIHSSHVAHPILEWSIINQGPSLKHLLNNTVFLLRSFHTHTMIIIRTDIIVPFSILNVHWNTILTTIVPIIWFTLGPVWITGKKNMKLSKRLSKGLTQSRHYLTIWIDRHRRLCNALPQSKFSTPRQKHHAPYFVYENLF